MTPPPGESLIDALSSFDGKRIDTLKAIAESFPVTPQLLIQLCELTQSEERKMQSASTWLLRRYHQAGAQLSPQQTAQLLQVLLQGSYWEARLHVLQMLDELCIPAELVEPLWTALIGQTCDQNKFIRAWAINGLVVLADQSEQYRDKALALLLQAEVDVAASVRARIRRIRKAFRWLR